METMTEGGSRGKGRPQEQLKCPRCKSSNTKFCYYNNYSLTQPRYFCKSCRRYWTDGGSLRNIPVGGGSRKNRKSTASVAVGGPSPTTHQSPPPPYQAHDLNLGFPATTTAGLENSHVGFGCYIPNLMPYPGRDVAEINNGPGPGPGPGGGSFGFSFSGGKEEQNSSTAAAGYWNNDGMFGGAPW